MESDQLPEGRYFCPRCNKKTQHEYLQGIPIIFYESASDEEIRRLEAETPEILTCTNCIDNEEDG